MKDRTLGCFEEVRTLLAYHSELIRLFPDLAPIFTSWVGALEKIQLEDDIETLKCEQQLDALALGFRSLWLRAANQKASLTLRSPLHYNLPENGSGEKCDFPYDRWGKQTLFEKQYGEKVSLPSHWEGQHFFFGNAMSALFTCLLQARKSMDQARISVLGKKGYFEISSLLKFISGRDISARLAADPERYNSLLRKGYADIILLEPVYCDDELTVWDQAMFLQAWTERPNRLETLIIMDTSLCGTEFDMQGFLSAMDEEPPAMVVEVSSALKLHQVGLEFANLGILSIYTPKALLKTRFQRQFPDNIEFARQTFGTGSNFAECLALEFPMAMDYQFFKDHCQKVFENNAHLAQRMTETKGMLAKVIHPALGEKHDISWAVAPFVLFKLEDGTNEDKRFLKRLLQQESKKRGIMFHSGSSFGFRSHRFEMGIRDEDQEITFRVAMGARKGPSIEGLVSLLNEVLSFPTFTDLRKAFPNIS